MADQDSAPRRNTEPTGVGSAAQPLKPTTDVQQVWVTLSLIVGAVGLFVYIVMPSIPRAESPLVGTEAPDFALPVIHGGDPGSRIRLSEWRGRVVVLDFWASWCAPCQEQALVLDALARRQSDGVAILGVATGDPLGAATEHANQHGLAYPSVHDTTGEVATAYGATDLPTVVVLDQQGRIVALRTGIVDAKAIDELIRQAD